jgi:hypothetical protein
MTMNFQHEQEAGTKFRSALRALRATAICAATLVFFGCVSTPKVMPVNPEIKASPAGTVEQSQSGARDNVPPGNDSGIKKDSASAETAVSPATSVEPPVAQSPVTKNDAAEPDVKQNGQDEKVETSLSSGSAYSAQEQADKELRTKMLQELKAALMESIKSDLTPSLLSEELKGFGEELSSSIRDDLLREIWLAKEEMKNNLKDQIRSEVTASIQENLQELEEQMKTEMHEDTLREIWGVRQDLGMFRFSGDIRLRYEDDRYGSNNFNEATKISQGVDTQTLLNTWANEEYLKYRVRFNVTAKVNEKLDAIIGLSTGSTSNPVSANTTVDNYMTSDSVLFGLAYLSWRPQENVTILGGRFPNPFFYTDLVWSPNLNFDGLAMKTETGVMDLTTSYLTVGAFPLQQSDPANIFDYSQHAKWLYAGQVGLERKDTTGISANIGAAYYYFDNISGVPNNDAGTPDATDWSSPLFTQKGNSIFYLIDPTTSGNYHIGLASKFKELNITGDLDIGLWDPIHIVFLGDYVTNLGFNKGAVLNLVGASSYVDSTDGYQVGLSVGYPETVKAGAWKASFYAKRLGNDAVVDAYTDSDFHLGGTNAQGWILGLDVGLATNCWLETRWLSADQINGPPLAIDVLLVDLNAKF